MDQQLFDFLESRRLSVSHISTSPPLNPLPVPIAISSSLSAARRPQSCEMMSTTEDANLMPFDDTPKSQCNVLPNEPYQTKLQRLLKSTSSDAEDDDGDDDAEDNADQTKQSIAIKTSKKDNQFEKHPCDDNGPKRNEMMKLVTNQPKTLDAMRDPFKESGSNGESEYNGSIAKKPPLAWQRGISESSSSCASVDRLLGSVDRYTGDEYDEEDEGEQSESKELYLDRLKRLEEEQEQLNSSLLALTSHFAHVQLRLQQIVSADAPSKEQLLKELEQFASRGVPQLCMSSLLSTSNAALDTCDESEVEPIDGNHLHHHSGQLDENKNERITSRTELQKLRLQRKKQKKLIEQLKQQLAELEQYAYECGDSSVVPSALLLQRQSLVIEQLKGRLPLQLDRLDQMSPEELRAKVDLAIKRLADPVVMKEQLVDQLKTQVTDLERFIQFLQKNGGKKALKNTKDCPCDCQMHSNKNKLSLHSATKGSEKTAVQKKRRTLNENGSARPEQIKSTGGRLLTAMQMMAMLQFGCNGNSVSGTTSSNVDFERNALKRTASAAAQHWGDLRAHLELTVQQILIEADLEEGSKSTDLPFELVRPADRLRWLVRRRLAPQLRALIEHGLLGNVDKTANSTISTSASSSSSSSALISWNCFSQRSRHSMTTAGGRHNRLRLAAWDLFQTYFYAKNGDKLKQLPARQLSQSFQLPLNGVKAMSTEWELLCAIDEINEQHGRLGRGPDSQFKAFVCRALNGRQLVKWLKLLFKSRHLLQRFYEPWSYVLSTGFEDGLRTLDKLTEIDFELPFDAGIRHLQTINDAF